MYAVRKGREFIKCAFIYSYLLVANERLIGLRLHSGCGEIAEEFGHKNGENTLKLKNSKAFMCDQFRDFFRAPNSQYTT